MGFLVDPRKNWALAEKRLIGEEDSRRRQILETLITHSKAEASADFERLMATVSPEARYRSFVGDDPEMVSANSPQGKEEVAAYYTGIVQSGCHLIEHDVERMVVGEHALTTEGQLKIAYPGAILSLMGIDVPRSDGHYLYEQRLLIVWEFDAHGMVICEDSYAGSGGGNFEGIADRPLSPDQIYHVTLEEVS